VLANRANERTDKLLAKRPTSMMLKHEPTCAKERKLMLEPQLPNPCTDNCHSDPTRVTPRMDMYEPMRL
jgi:hypothetical protein